MSQLQLDIVEGPGAGRRIALDAPKVIGRGADADIATDDERASRRHARVSPSGSGAIVEDLGSTNGTFINGNEVAVPTALVPGDELLVGVTVMLVRDRAEARDQPSGIRQAPPALAVAARAPAYVKRDRASNGAPAERPARSPVPELDALVDRRTRRRARLAPLAVFVLVALAVMIYLAST